MGGRILQQDLLRHQARLVGREAVALALIVGVAGGVSVIEDDRSEVDAERAEYVGQILLGRGAGLHADRAAGQTFQRVDVHVGANHHALTIVEGDGRKVEAQGCVAADRHGGVAAQHVDFTSLQDGEALVGRGGTDFDGRCIAQRRHSKYAAEVDVEAFKFVGVGVNVTKSRNRLVAGAAQGSTTTYRLQRVAGRGGGGRSGFGRRFGSSRHIRGYGLGRGLSRGGFLGLAAASRQRQSEDNHHRQ